MQKSMSLKYRVEPFSQNERALGVEQLKKLFATEKTEKDVIAVEVPLPLCLSLSRSQDQHDHRLRPPAGVVVLLGSRFLSRATRS